MRENETQNFGRRLTDKKILKFRFLIADAFVDTHLFFPQLLDSILPLMKANCKGHIVFLKSVAALSGFTHQIALSVSQYAVQGLYESVVEELRVSKLDSIIKTTLVHIYPLIVNDEIPN